MRGAGVETDTHGAKRTIYSLRHTYATFRLESGVDIYQLARNMGTSVAMIEQFYGHTSNVAAAAELTRAPRSQKSANGNDLGWLDAAHG